MEIDSTIHKKVNNEQSTRQKKIDLCKPLIMVYVTYGCGAWAMTVKDREILLIL